jgi:glutathione synthase/RimK-type ligase-like ATP-grasp enzyme
MAPGPQRGARWQWLRSRADVARAVGLRRALDERRINAQHRHAGLVARRAAHTAMWRAAAVEIGAELRHIGTDFLEISRAGRRTRVLGGLTPLDDPVTRAFALDKPLVHAALTDAGVPVAEHLDFCPRELTPALAFLARANGPVVVKPAQGTGAGYGVTTGVRSPRDLRRAVPWAAALSGQALVERQHPGDVLRFLVLDGQVIDVVRRRRPAVTGDGRSTVSALILAESRRRLSAGGYAAFTPLRVDLDCLLTLRSQRLSLDAVLPEGRRVEVKGVSNENAPEDNSSVLDTVDEHLLADAVTAARCVGLTLAGVDVCALRLDSGLTDNGGIVLEVNPTPGLHHHYRVRDPDRAVQVAVPILEHLLGRSSHAVATKIKAGG